MKSGAKHLFVVLLALGLAPLLGQTPSQHVPLSGPATRLSEVEYWPYPQDKQVKLRLEGAKMDPLPETKFDVKELKVIMFSKTGKLQAVVEAPQCVYAPMDGVATSAGHLQLKLEEDKVHIEGDGFLWRQNENSLDISNNVYTVIKTGAWKLPVP
ncbi:MAG TPA: hypothetical protein VL970_01225 [Candidatus Acidoferrales bacterium]|nr:hypothetical protein [Candidatus Acidoferrales bacterium]